VAVGVMLVASGCSPFGSERTSDDGSPAEHAALDAFFEDPLYLAEPPSTGQVLEEVEETECRERSHEPGASRTYELLSDGEDVAAFYEQEAAEQNWELVLERPIDPDAEFSGSRPSLVFERPEREMTLTLFVRFNRDLFTAEPSVTVGGGVVDASFCG
jgi:hypothetical protein